METKDVLKQAVIDLPTDNPLREALFEIAAAIPAPAVVAPPQEPTYEPGLTVVEEPNTCSRCLDIIQALRDKWENVSKSGAIYSEYCVEFCADLDAAAAIIRGDQ